ncbi:MAG: hypothetical protein ABH896_02685 [Candidatus Jacksonbacteria bacterium]
MTAQDLKQFKDLLKETFFEFKEKFRQEIKIDIDLAFDEFRQEEHAYIKQMFDEFKQVNKKERRIELAQFTEEVLLPAIQNLIKQEIAPLKNKMEGLGGISRIVTKDYCDDKQSDLRGDVLANRKKDSARLDALIQMQYKKDSLTDKEIEKLEKMRGFAPLPAEI